MAKHAKQKKSPKKSTQKEEEYKLPNGFDQLDHDSLQTIADGDIESFDDMELEEFDEEEGIETLELEPVDVEVDLSAEGPTPAAKKDADFDAELDDELVYLDEGQKKQRPASSQKQRALSDRQQAEEFVATSTAYPKRWCACFIGLSGAFAAHAAAQYELFFKGLELLLAESQIIDWQLYTAAGISAFIIIGLLCCVLACFDRSLFRCVHIGMAWALVAIIAVSAWTTQRSARALQDDHLHQSLAILQLTLAPALNTHALQERAQEGIRLKSEAITESAQ